MMTSPEEKIHHALRSMFPKQSSSAISLVQLGGYNNINYKATISNKDYFVKFANRDEKLVGSSLENEVQCRKRVHGLSIAPELMLYDEKESIMVTNYIEGNFSCNKKDSKHQYIRLLHSLHHSDVEFPRSFCPFETIRRYIELAETRGVILPEALSRQILPTIYAFRKEDLFLDKTPCHLDPQFANVLDNGDQLYLIDWEFAAMSEPLFDLASMCASEKFSDDEMREILGLYLQRAPNNAEWQRFYILRILADLRMCLFCYLYTSIAIASSAVYKDFADAFFSETQRRLATPPRDTGSKCDEKIDLPRSSLASEEQI